MNIKTVVDKKRGCGWRKPGGFYMIASGQGVECCQLPIPLFVCPCCSQGIKPNRGFTWISRQLLDRTDLKCLDPLSDWRSSVDSCPMAYSMQSIGDRLGLIWIGEQFYNSPGQFSREAADIGISRRLKQIPRGFEVGKTWVALAHRKAIGPMFPNDVLVPEYRPGIFSIFRPQAIEYVVKGTESESELQSIVDRGCDLIHVLHEGEPVGQLFDLTDQTE